MIFTSHAKGFAGGGIGVSEGVLSKTNSGGDNWLANTNINPIMSIHFPNPDTGYCVGWGGTYLKTTDGGDSWSTGSINSNGDGLNSVFFTDGNKGCAVGGWGMIRRTTNGGALWVPVDWQEGNTLNSVFFTSKDTGYAVGEGIILKTTHAGNLWTPLVSGSNIVFNCVYFVNSNTGYVVGSNGTIMMTMNAGADWFTQSSGTVNSLTSVYFPSIDTGYIVGSNGTVLRTTDGGGTGVYVDHLQPAILKIYPNPVKDKFIIELPSITGNALISILNVNGRELMNCKITDCKTQLDITNYPAGVYLLRLKTEKTVKVGKILKE